MKKLFGILAAVLALSCATVFTSCDEPLVAQENTWYRVDKEVAGVNVRAYVYYTQKEVTCDKTVLEPGITIAVTPSSMSAKLYAIKTFPKSDKEVEVTEEATSLREAAETTEEGDGEEKENSSSVVSLMANGTTMDAFLIGCKKAGIDVETIKTDYPTLLDSKDGYQTADSLKDLFGKDVTWKDLVKGIINAVL